MDDITLVRQLRAEVAEPDSATLHRMRNNVVAGLRDGSSSRPARSGLGVRLLAAFRHRRPAVRFGLVAAAVAAVVASTIVVDAVTTPDGRPVVGHAAAAAELRRAAAAAIRVSDQPLQPGQFYYLRTVAVAGNSIGGGPCGGLFYLRKDVYETWVPKAWEEQWMQRRVDEAERQFFRPSDEARANQCQLHALSASTEVRKAPAGLFYPEGLHRPAKEPQDGTGAVVYDLSPEEVTRRLAAGNWQSPTPQFMAGLPRDPKQLLERIYRDSKGQWDSHDDEAFLFVRDVLRSGVVPADLRAALFSAAALIPGVRLVSDSVNLEGRHGVAVAMSDEGKTRVEMIFDPETGDVIGEREVLLTPNHIEGVPAGTAVAYTAVSRQVVGAMGATAKN
ncbi:hypothetical protein GA0074695_4160 [Micromonospora viridifaciens]|uniref:CU044_5270 family protein n=1 Tax=Micromonospora viridifaciens TaxID=1881 RepID=A0A1C4YET6_MICVI|nr:CU044_5270 family protein [Micromonospora viridifaciens]SCF18861.1 hypothetical protein GA0074695_4160 [Micromonospora viridifaciens]